MEMCIVIERGKRGEENFGCYCPDAPGCMTTGSSIEETIQNMKQALALYFEGESWDGKPQPPEVIAKKINFKEGDLLASVHVAFQQEKVA